MISELMPEVRKHIHRFGAVFIEGEKSLIDFIGYLVFPLYGECETEFQIEFRVGIVHEDEILVDEFRFFVVPVFLVEGSEETIQVLIEFLHGEPFDDTGSRFTELPTGDPGLDGFYKFAQVLFLVPGEPFFRRFRFCGGGFLVFFGSCRLFFCQRFFFLFFYDPFNRLFLSEKSPEFEVRMEEAMEHMECYVDQIDAEKGDLVFYEGTGEEYIHGGDMENRMTALYGFFK
jgi:hypothetical protein